MNEKFTQCIFVEKDRDTFLEYDSLNDLLDECGADYINDIIGYFPSETNITYKELEETKEELSWVVAYHQKIDNTPHSSHILKHFYSTLELKRKIDSIIKDTYNGRDYVTIYKATDIVYL